jgi:hypothetical protein
MDKLHLPNVEIVSINTHNPTLSIKALEYSSNHIQFSKKKIFSHIPSAVRDIEHIHIPQFVTREQYSIFCIQELHKYIESDFVLMIHDDGFVINPHLWTDEFLQYDCIGAPWPGNPDDPTHGRVGNGGFTLRSKKLLKTITQFTETDINEDWLIGVTKKDYLESLGIKFAPVELAMRFSLELPIEECEYNLENTFGFHGKRSFQHYQKIDLLNQVII